MSTRACPNCGGPLPRQNPGMLSASCEYCHHLVYWNETGVVDSGRESHLSEGYTRLFRGARGILQGHAFEVMGRIRYGYSGGVRDEWSVLLDGELVWVSEDDHQLCLQRRMDHNDSMLDISALQLGTDFEVGHLSFRVVELGTAHCVGVEGQVPRGIELDERYRFINAGSLDGGAALSIELDDVSPTLFVGHWLEQSEVMINGEDDL